MISDCTRVLEQAKHLFELNQDNATVLLRILTGNNSAKTLEGVVDSPHVILKNLEIYHLVKKDSNTTYVLTPCGAEAVPVAREYAPSTMDLY